MELDGRTAVVTGAASGIGLALTERFLAEGMRVVMADVEQPALERESARIADAGGDVTPVVCDVSDADQVAGLRDAALAAYGSVHLLCNNAGVASGRPNHRTKPAVWDWVVGVNLLGPAYGVSTFVPLMLEQGEGHVVNTASEAGLTASPMLGSYHATKYAVVGLSESLAMELEGTPVGVTCLCPELVDTRIFEATRNAPPALGLPEPATIPIDQIAAAMGTVAMPPADLAADVVYAVRAGQFWVLTHQSTRARVHARNRRLEQGKDPKFGPGSGGL
jgi:NAD(P)-dependent dehydrogenase (short-subunit alcohol dehydrogenase family)